MYFASSLIISRGRLTGSFQQFHCMAGNERKKPKKSELLAMKFCGRKSWLEHAKFIVTEETRHMKVETCHCQCHTQKKVNTVYRSQSFGKKNVTCHLRGIRKPPRKGKKKFAQELLSTTWPVQQISPSSLAAGLWRGQRIKQRRKQGPEPSAHHHLFTDFLKSLFDLLRLFLSLPLSLLGLSQNINLLLPQAKDQD